ncbi:peptidoglycan-binding protein [Clostridium paraputrificum]|uniref:peptidoglycan-binding domain-containing protein n=1 Tax=Clostridium paraputrificum TaxID=29363 RepID=UPI00232EC24E|nr:peptidoglycan-binding protein [Clostridium paraputrificum]MDB2076557.1 peptidoglycan-binding protein [Clostridium paraputrificum]MDB2080062.1 peptidoglycan-binding protein [Clostridium paraputrificum]
MKKRLSLLLLFVLCFQLSSTTVFAITNDNTHPVIAIIDGVNVYKDDINEDGSLKDSVLSSVKNSSYNSSTKGAYATVTKGTNAILSKTLTVPSASMTQQTDIYYLNPETATTYAYYLTSTTVFSILAEGSVSIVLGYLIKTPHFGAVYTVASMLASLSVASVSQQILEYSQKGKSVEVRMIKSNLGATAYYVGEWNGTTINPTLTNTNVSTEKITSFKKSENVIVGGNPSTPYPGYAVKKGSTGSTVTQVQKRLNYLGFTLSADNSFGPATDSAVRNFQRSRGISVDGSVGPTTWNYLFNRTFKPSYPGHAVKKGSTGATVITVQARLNQLGYNLGAPDGSFGPATDAAVRSFQRSRNLSIDGSCGPATWSKLFI